MMVSDDLSKAAQTWREFIALLDENTGTPEARADAIARRAREAQEIARRRADNGEADNGTV
jgi:hypothetical protein